MKILHLCWTTFGNNITYWKKLPSRLRVNDLNVSFDQRLIGPCNYKHLSYKVSLPHRLKDSVHKITPASCRPDLYVVSEPESRERRPWAHAPMFITMSGAQAWKSNHIPKVWDEIVFHTQWWFLASDYDFLLFESDFRYFCGIFYLVFRKKALWKK